MSARDAESLASTLQHVEAMQRRIARLIAAREEALRQAAHRATTAHDSGDLSLDELADWYAAYREIVKPSPGRAHDGWTGMWPRARELATNVHKRRASVVYRRNEAYGWSGPAPLLADSPRPRAGEAVVYVLYAATEPVYVGSTQYFKGRLAAHLRDKTFDRWLAYPCADREAAYALEDELLRDRFPLLNRRRGR